MKLPGALSAALGRLNWDDIQSSLQDRGFAHLPEILTPQECASLEALYKEDTLFRSRIDMARLRFGVGEYKYFAAPLPPLVDALRHEFYTPLAPIANSWQARLERAPFPPSLEEFLKRCHRAGQRRPTPLLLAYTKGGYNCLHQDIYGDLAFPLQVMLMLNRVDADYSGGEFLLVEQRPRAQSRGHALRVEQGAGVVFATRERPVAGTRGNYRVVLRHGVSTVVSGARMTLGIIFHDAR